MSKSVLIFGAGSIGNHMAHAARKLKLNVYVTDIKNDSLVLMKQVVYKKRYGFWDDKIKIIEYKNVFNLKNYFDLIIIGTPPQSHIKTFFKIKNKLKYNKILIEKPLTNFKNNLKIFADNKYSIRNKVFIGYNHSISESFLFFIELLKKKNKSELNEINVVWKESWKKIMDAHFWLKKLNKSYISRTRHGGGALHEHSHGLHILILLLNAFKIKIKKIKKNIFYNKKLKYDESVNLDFIEDNILINYNTNLISYKIKKKVMVSGNNFSISWINNFKKNFDAVIFSNKNITKIYKFKKTRSSEFQNEIKYLLNIKKKDVIKSNLNISHGIEVMNLINKILL
jgi:predicted dehydrogenase